MGEPKVAIRRQLIVIALEQIGIVATQSHYTTKAHGALPRSNQIEATLFG
jgi:hypothetical protein